MRTVLALLLLASFALAPPAAAACQAVLNGQACVGQTADGGADARVIGGFVEPTTGVRTSHDLTAKAAPTGVEAGGFVWHPALGKEEPAIHARPAPGGAEAGVTRVSPGGNADVDVTLTGTRVRTCVFTSSGSLGCF